MKGDLAPMRSVAVFEKENPLPGSERQCAADERNRELRLGERGADMRRHVVGAFRIMRVIRLFRRKPREDGFEIAQHGRIGVFLNEQRGGGVSATVNSPCVMPASRAKSRMFSVIS